jgi:hypothetical protein
MRTGIPLLSAGTISGTVFKLCVTIPSNSGICFKTNVFFSMSKIAISPSASITKITATVGFSSESTINSKSLRVASK